VLKNTGTSRGALAAKVLRNGDVERSLGRRNARSAGSVDVPRDQGSTDDGVGGGVNDRNVGSTLVRSADFKLDRDLLAGGERLNEILVVLVLETLALPDLALLSVVVGLGSGNLELSLNVSIVITSYFALVSLR
jgi:hypothetical protein